MKNYGPSHIEEVHKQRNAGNFGNQHFSPFPTMFSAHPKKEFLCLSYIYFFICQYGRVLKFVRRYRVIYFPTNDRCFDKVINESMQWVGKNYTVCQVQVGWLVVLGFNPTLTAMVISWQSVTHMYFLAFSHQY